MKDMMTMKTRLSHLAAPALSLAGVFALAGSALAQDAPAAPEPPKGWIKVCDKQADVDICQVQNVVTASTGQLVTAVSLVDVKGKQNRRVFQVTVPSGRLVPPGIGLQVDSGKQVKLDYVICFPDRCLAEAPLNDALVASFKKGSNLTLTSINFQNQPNPVKVSLQGFGGAFDGDPIKPADLQAQQKKLEDYVKQNNADFAKKLKDAQDKAKESN